MEPVFFKFQVVHCLKITIISFYYLHDQFVEWLLVGSSQQTIITYTSLFDILVFRLIMYNDWEAMYFKLITSKSLNIKNH